jgi:hypothetical protein
MRAAAAFHLQRSTKRRCVSVSASILYAQAHASDRSERVLACPCSCSNHLAPGRKGPERLQPRTATVRDWPLSTIERCHLWARRVQRARAAGSPAGFVGFVGLDSLGLIGTLTPDSIMILTRVERCNMMHCMQQTLWDAYACRWRASCVRAHAHWLIPARENFLQRVRS